MEMNLDLAVNDVEDVDDVQVASTDVEIVEQEDEAEIDTWLEDERASTADESDFVDYWINSVVVPVMNYKEFLTPLVLLNFVKSK